MGQNKLRRCDVFCIRFTIIQSWFIVNERIDESLRLHGRLNGLQQRFGHMTLLDFSWVFLSGEYQSGQSWLKLAGSGSASYFTRSMRWKTSVQNTDYNIYCTMRLWKLFLLLLLLLLYEFLLVTRLLLHFKRPRHLFHAVSHPRPDLILCSAFCVFPARLYAIISFTNKTRVTLDLFTRWFLEIYVLRFSF